ncbi:hypothetical protein QKU48_gp0035 [Fadolivirus algeromassiliense]|jgi:hypothetical protein|uniref:Uncharacterized protein n=1 Tax=Fadolivirus FV1/VV64 TaxID=3070911 RepID=A0A7D3UQ57_9VIRU|nr:hypothetical protein QKU48_gp0035 [Fadolivirus algeromassiliense]QKF93493.1 hypothetical protein Fadolivirus_1_35 [Fadolivirus FV1/VV64]
MISINHPPNHFVPAFINMLRLFGFAAKQNLSFSQLAVFVLRILQGFGFKKICVWNPFIGQRVWIIQSFDSWFNTWGGTHYHINQNMSQNSLSGLMNDPTTDKLFPFVDGSAFQTLHQQDLYYLVVLVAFINQNPHILNPYL